MSVFSIFWHWRRLKWRIRADVLLRVVHMKLAAIVPRSKYAVAKSGHLRVQNTVGQRHRNRAQILCWAGPAYTGPAQAPRLQPGRHDFLRLYRTLLAADRGRQAHHAADVAAHLPDPGHDRGSHGARIGPGSREKT